MRWIAKRKDSREWQIKLTEVTWFAAREVACMALGCDRDQVELKEVESAYG